jgi:hypothetical protein
MRTRASHCSVNERERDIRPFSNKISYNICRTNSTLAHLHACLHTHTVGAAALLSATTENDNNSNNFVGHT